MTARRRPGGSQHVPRPDGWGDDERRAPASFATPPTVSTIVAALDTYRGDVESGPVGFADARHSAVLVLLTDGPDGAEVLLTRRSMELRDHRGEVSFPGGRSDPGERPADTALREAAEEVGLDPSDVTVAGELRSTSTIVSRSLIVPVVATTPRRLDLAATSVEVDRVLWVPLSELVRPDTYHAENWGGAGDRGSVSDAGTPRVLHFFMLDDETVWGVTARILIDLLDRIGAA